MRRAIEDGLTYWQGVLGLGFIQIRMEQISQEQVTDTSGNIGHDLVGISLLDRKSRTAILFHTGSARGLSEEDVVHELTHLKMPQFSRPEDHHLIDEETTRWLNGKGSKKWDIDWNGSLWLAKRPGLLNAINLQR